MIEDLGDGYVVRDDEDAIHLDEQPTGSVVTDAPPDVTLTVDEETSVLIEAEEPNVSLSEIDDDDADMVVFEETLLVSEIAEGVQGPAGPAGEPGAPGAPGADGTDGDKTYIHDQMVPSETWAITHNLGKRPSVSVVDSAGSVVEGDVDYDDINQLTITFTTPFAGAAYLN